MLPATNSTRTPFNSGNNVLSGVPRYAASCKLSSAAAPSRGVDPGVDNNEALKADAQTSPEKKLEANGSLAA